MLILKMEDHKLDAGPTPPQGSQTKFQWNKLLFGTVQDSLMPLV
jgi:hypothetical protein